MRSRILPTVIAAILLAGPVSVSAQDLEPGGDQQLQGLIGEIRTLLERAEQERSADPWLIRDMRALLARYDWPWTRDIYAEDFTRTANGIPRPWRVTEGAVTVDRTLGLRTVVPRSEAEQAGQEQPREEQPRERGDSVRDMLGRILEEAVRPEGQQRDSQQQEQRQQREVPSQTRAMAAIEMPNAFAMRVELSARSVSGTGGGFAFGPHQGDEADAGYRLIYHPEPRGQAPAFELVKRSPRGTESTVEFYHSSSTATAISY